MCDFDDGNWKADAAAYAEACSNHGVAAATQISRSGAGAHVWIFFAEPASARIARSLGASLLRAAMTIQWTMSLSSYDRFFPAQDLLPPRAGSVGNQLTLQSGGTINLIA